MIILSVRRDILAMMNIRGTVAPILLIVIVWGLCYLPNLRTSPGWYGDETLTLLAGQSILRGDFANRALTYSFFSPFTNYQPPALTAYAISASLTSGDILGARLLSALIALVLALMVNCLLRTDANPALSIGAALTVLLVPQHVIHFRWAYPHYFCSLGVMFIGLLLATPPSNKRDWLMGVGCGVAACGHLLAIYVVLAACASCYRRPSSWYRIALPPVAVLSLSLILGYWSSGSQLVKDLGELAGTYSSSSQTTNALGKVTTFIRFFTWDIYHVLMLVALGSLAFRHRLPQFIFIGTMAVVIIQNRAELPVFYYQSMVFVPLLSVYAVEFLQAAVSTMASRLKLRDVSHRALAAASVVILPLSFGPAAVKSAFAGNHTPRNEFWVAPSTVDLERSADWINDHSTEGDLIISFWDAGWLLRERWTDLMQCAVWQYGKFPFFYDRYRGHDEFRYPANLADARFVLVGQLDLRWLWGQGSIPRLLEDYQVIKWPVVYRTETTVVLSNPAFLERNSRNNTASEGTP